MKPASDDYRVGAGRPVKLGKWPTLDPRIDVSAADYPALLARQVQRLSSLQEVLYASNRYALLVIFQGMDTSGKDSAIKHVMSGVNPQGCTVTSFKQPGPEALAHDFLWRAMPRLPARGHIGIFNRSYYEDVLVVRVHPELLPAAGFPVSLAKGGRLWQDRYRSIVDLERHLHCNGTRIVKIFLHLSKDEQKKRLLERIDDPAKNWKFNPSDLVERACWKQYMQAYEACIDNTSHGEAPWYIVPADSKKSARIVIAQIVVEALSKLDIDYPQLDAARQRKLQELRAELTD